MRTSPMPAALSLVAALFSSACASELSYVNVSLSNSSAVTLTVGIADLIQSQLGNPNQLGTYSVPPGATLLEVPYEDLVFVFQVSGPGLRGTEVTCTATQSIIATSDYGLVDIFVASGTSDLTAECSSGWEQFQNP